MGVQVLPYQSPFTEIAMGRNVTRTAELSLDLVQQITGLFGTIKNAHTHLGLEGLVPYHALYRALQFLPVKPTEREVIEHAWARWRELYLRPETPPSADLKVTALVMDEYPKWHPDGKLKVRRKSA